MVVTGQDQKTTIIGDQVQAVVLMTEIPTDPAVTGCTLPALIRQLSRHNCSKSTS
jgi:hypothetical protein